MTPKLSRPLAMLAAVFVVFTILFLSHTILGKASESMILARPGNLPVDMISDVSLDQITPPWYNNLWHYRLPVTINNPGAALTNYQVLVTLNNTFAFSHAQSDGRDLRVTTSDGVTAANFWIESWDGTNQIAYVWVKVPSIPNNGTTTIYLYYGNASANATGDGVNTFDFFDDAWCQYPGGTGCGPTNPVLTASQSWWESYLTYPMVFEDTSLPGRPRYHMLYDGHNVIGHAKGYAYSSDLNTWTEYDMGGSHPPNPNPIMGTGYAGNSAFAWGDTIKVGSTYYMFASAGPGTTQLITSTNLITWTGFIPLSVNDVGGIGTGVAILKQGDGITPIQVDGKYWMVYFHGFAQGTMYMASSTDLLNWTYTGGPFLAPTPGGFDASGLWTPSFIRFDNMYYIYYQGQSSGGAWETGYARASAYSGENPISPDPASTTWNKSDTNSDGIPDSVLQRGTGGSWDSGEVIDPMVRRFSDGVYYLFYTGNQNDGYATASAPDGPWTKLGSVNAQWSTVAGSPTVSGGILTLNQGTGLKSIPTFQYQAVGYRANFGVGSGLLWGGFINGSTFDRTMVGSVNSESARLYLKNFVGSETTSRLCDGTCRGSYHTYEVLWRSGQSLARMDHGVASASLTSQVPSVALPVTFYSYSSSGATLAVDWIYVRQYRNPEPTTQTGTETSIIDLQVAKTGFPNPVRAGEHLTYTITVTNSSPIVAPGVLVTDVLPGGVSVVSFNTGQGSCVQLGSIRCTLGNVAISSTVRISIVVTSSVEGLITNTVTVASSAHELTPADNQATVTTTVLPSADLRVSQVDEPDPVRAGESLTYTITVHNSGPSLAENVVLIDTFPSEMVLTGATTPQGSCTPPPGRPLTCNLGAMTNGQEVVVKVFLDTPLDGLYTNTVTVSSSTHDPNLLNNTSHESTLVATQADLGVSQTVQPGTVYAGELLTYTITVHNAGPNIATNVHLTDTLPSGVTLLSVTPSPGSCNSGAVITCTLGNLQVGGNATVIVVVNTTVDGFITNIVSVISDTPDQHLSNNLSQVTKRVNPAADLGVSQVDTPDPVRAGYPLTYTLTVHNSGPSSSGYVLLTDSLPAGVDFVSAEPVAYCLQASLVVCTLPGLPSGEDSQVQVVVLTTQEGLLTNTVTVASSTYDRNLTNNTSLENTVVATAADLSITQIDTPDPVLAEGQLTYQLTVHNAGPSIAAAVRLTDTLPGGVILQSVTPDNGSCSQGSVIVCTLGNLASGANVHVVVVVVPQTAGNITNSVEVSTRTYEANLTDNTSTVNTTVLPLSADLSLSLTGAPNPVAAGALLTYTAHVTNLGPSRAINPSLIVHLSNKVRFIGSTPVCSEQTGTVTCLWNEIASGGSANVAITVQVFSSALVSQISSQADVTSSVADPVTVNNHAVAITNLNREADLSIAVYAEPNPVAPQTYLTYTLVYTNGGPSDAINLILTDTLPADVDYMAGLSNPECDAVPATHYVRCSPSDLEAGLSSQIVLMVKVKEVAVKPLVNEVEIASETPDPDLNNNIAEITTNLDVVPPSLHWLAPEKDDSTSYYVPIMYPGLEITLTVMVTDNVRVDRVLFKRWDHVGNYYVEIGTGVEISPGIYQYVWVFSSYFELVPGQNQVYAYAYDTAGNYVRARIWVWPYPYPLALPVVIK